MSKPPFTLALATGLLLLNLGASPLAWSAPALDQPAAGMLLLSSADHGRRIDIAPGSEFTLTLVDNPSTGYRWSLAPFNRTVVQLISETALPSNVDASGSLSQPQPVGRAGQVVFRFKALRPGQTVISLKLYRSWEGDRSTINRFKITLNVHPHLTRAVGSQPGLVPRP